jgi:hypothetical protein
MTMIALMMEAVIISETSVNFYQTTQRNIPEGYLHTRRLGNLKSHLTGCWPRSSEYSQYIFSQKLFIGQLNIYL